MVFVVRYGTVMAEDRVEVYVATTLDVTTVFFPFVVAVFTEYFVVVLTCFEPLSSFRNRNSTSLIIAVYTKSVLKSKAGRRGTNDKVGRPFANVNTAVVLVLPVLSDMHTSTICEPKWLACSNPSECQDGDHKWDPHCSRL